MEQEVGWRIGAVLHQDLQQGFSTGFVPGTNSYYKVIRKCVRAYVHVDRRKF